jgi:drug/metabolite transporter (DMT)-like permease
MENLLFYILTVVIWGSTWIAIKFQLGTIDPLVSVIYRFTLAATLLMAWCIIKRLNMRFTLREHGFMALQGTLLFSINYWLFYLAELHITSGLAAVIFSTIVVMNMVNGNLFLKVPFDPKVIAGGTLGLTGIIFVFKPELSSFHLADSGIKGMVLCLIATYCASLGNIISARNQKNGLPIIQSNAYGMAYGTILMLAVALIKGKQFAFILSTSYVTALIYLAVFGSIVAFGCYLTLIGRIGADRAAYATLLFPIVALLISTVWENYHWSHEAFIGVTLILFGNLLMVKKRKKIIRAELLT